MRSVVIRSAEAVDRRFPLHHGAGSDAIHAGAEYAFAVTQLNTDAGIQGTGIVLTLGAGNQLVCQAIRELLQYVEGREIEELMADFGAFMRRLADHASLRWLGPHKGVVHLALASVVNACFDLWAKARGVPLWRLLLDLSPDQMITLLDFSYVDDEMNYEDALALLKKHQQTRSSRESILAKGYPGYDTSVGWFQYDDEQVAENARRALGAGFRALKLKIGSADEVRDLRRARMLHEIAGEDCRLMLDVNQQWSLQQARHMCRALRDVNPYWIEEPTHPDDIQGHAKLAAEIAPLRIAAGEHLPNRVVFKNYLQLDAFHFVQPDCTRLAGISEFITVSLLARQFNRPVVPHVGDMGQIHQHLVLFNHIALDQEVMFLEHIPHLREYFIHPADISDGVYRTPQEPGASSDLKPKSAA